MISDLIEIPQESTEPLKWGFDLDSESLTTKQLDWFDKGVVILPSLMNTQEGTQLMEAYCERFEEANVYPHGWGAGTPYMTEPTLLNLFMYTPLTEVLRELLGEPAGLHLNLTGWISTERDWHQDTYLNPSFVGDFYTAVWMALDDVSPDAGPFEYIPRSHKWGVITREMVLDRLTPMEKMDPDWPKFTESIVTPSWKAEIERRNANVKSFMAKKGDVLIWHSKIVHRGSAPKIPGTTRKAVISHLSGLNHRADMPNKRQHPNGGWYFVF
jgi:hypothetical protein